MNQHQEKLSKALKEDNVKTDAMQRQRKSVLETIRMQANGKVSFSY
jgi:hypothetical protein